MAKVCPYGIVSVLCGQNGRGLMEAALSTKIEQPPVGHGHIVQKPSCFQGQFSA